MPASTKDFSCELRNILKEAEGLGLVAVDVRAKNLHARLGGYPNPEPRMPACCNAMNAEVGTADVVVKAPPSGKGASLIIRYMLPRNAQCTVS